MALECHLTQSAREPWGRRARLQISLHESETPTEKVSVEPVTEDAHSKGFRIRFPKNAGPEALDGLRLPHGLRHDIERVLIDGVRRLESMREGARAVGRGWIQEKRKSARAPVPLEHAFVLTLKNLFLSGSGRKLCQLYDKEGVLAREMRVLRDEMKDAMDKLNTIHLIEMEQFSNALLESGDSTRLTELVDKHVAETELTQKHWMQRAVDLMESQKKEFAECVFMIANDSYEEEGIDDEALVKEEEFSKSTSQSCRSTRFWSSKRRNEEYHAFKPKSSNVPLFSTANEYFGTHTVWFGEQNKISFDVGLSVGRILDLCFCEYNPRSTRDTSRIECSTTLFSDRLTAMVLCHSSGILPNMLIAGCPPRIAEFSKCCDSSTDFVFPRFADQIISLEEKLKGLKQLGTGEFFTSKHSNLRNIHLVFHLVTGSSTLHGKTANTASRDHVFQGLENIVLRANSAGVESLIIPVLFGETRILSASKPAQETIDHIRAVFSRVKKCLVSIARDKGSKRTLRNVKFLLPLSVTEEIRESLHGAPLVSRAFALLEESFQGSF